MEKYLPQAILVAHLPGASRIIASASKLTLSPRDFALIAESMDDAKTEEWIRELVKRGHGSPLEHSIFIFEVVCSRVCSHQLVRHRHASFSQLSQRYSDKYLRNMVVKIFEHTGRNPREAGFREYVEAISRFLSTNPSFEELLDIASEAFIVPPSVVKLKDAEFLRFLLEGVKSYYEALANGVPYEDVRYLLPQAVKTRLLVSMNARELLEVFIPLRTCARAQWEIRIIAWKMLSEVSRVEPLLFKYAGPRCILQDNRSRIKPCTLNEYLSGECSFTIERCPELVPKEKIRECISTALII
ncbi:MAG: FAD-dependent thymidylate synthase [Desulfurococcus sp.]|uniref:FAD-dependent thymidylate synthase n=1 Tax=Desulfurococcus sp. TaxID=51678 RepID=UPI00315EBE97